MSAHQEPGVIPSAVPHSTDARPDPSAPGQPQQPGGEKALPCPFCGVPPLIHPPDNDCAWDFVLCWSDDCHAHPAVRGDDPHDAGRKWNRRAHEPDVRAQALEEAAQVCDRAAAQDAACGDDDGATTAIQCAVNIRALIVTPPPVPSRDHLSTWREGVEAAAVVLDALGDHSHDKGTLPNALAALCASQCAQHVRDFGAQGRPDLARPVPPAGATP